MALASQKLTTKIDILIVKKGPDGESIKNNALKEFNKSMVWQLSDNEATILINRLEILSDVEQKKLNPKLIAILILATVPASLTALTMYLFSANIPPWLQAATLVEILMIEGMISYFSGKISFMADSVTDVYSKIVELGADMKRPLADLAQVMYEFRDILPIVADIAKDIDKEAIKRALITWRESFTKDKNVQREEIAAIAKRITKKD